ncbi:pantoate--beta-alanine ligase [Rubinisphaera margarita]|uniref:pantoate--beta-alanine ligase n=1 Tax=Rubinisphaera margarita TaxID=2909586 RepID=UPI001EE905A5|nr:pantoate--beta-alanine ligase [Rubinisphaera margarita]MCG6156869.1 pantoate--beta-alanine ligase [Rubinisphaera margarita]
MQTATTIAETRRIVRDARVAGKIVGCVPTMGALHAGHVSLIEAARRECDFVVVTIFVNPTQFAPHEDLEKYPRPFKNDLEKCEAAGADLVFHPSVDEMYPVERQVNLHVGDLASRWEGTSRPDHFDGVATVVLKLFNITLPDKAFFGAKDFQQQAIIRCLCRDLDVPVEIVTCPTVREESGLAMSSRNVYLSDTERETALAISRALTNARDRFQNPQSTVAEVRQQLRQDLEAVDGLELDYATVVEPVELTESDDEQPEMVALVAARVGKTRLIDNMLLHSSEQGS